MSVAAERDDLVAEKIGLVTRVRELENELEYVYRAILRGFQNHSFDFTVVQNRAVAFMEKLDKPPFD